MPSAYTRHGAAAGRPAADTAIRTFAEVARIMASRGLAMTEKSCWATERRALFKIRQQFPELANLMEEDHQ